jgi:hypothetical protein
MRTLSMPNWRKALRPFIATLAVAAGIAAVQVAAPQGALAASPGASIPQATIKWRAEWWLNKYGAIYGQDQIDARPAPGAIFTTATTGKLGVGKPEYSEYYRPDCSGFVSMAWHLPKLNTGWDLSTTNFWDLSGTFSDGTSVSSKIESRALASLQPGDAIVRQGHIRLFDGWANSGHTSYYAYEEYNYGQDARWSTFTLVTDGTWRGVHYKKQTTSPSLSVTEYCTYTVTSGTVNVRSGNGTSYTGEGLIASGLSFLASTENSGGWRRASGKTFTGDSASYSGWVYTGDGGSFSRSSGGCTTA